MESGQGHLWHILGKGGTGIHLEASWRPLVDIWEVWVPKVPPRWSEGSKAQKSVTSPSENQHFHEKV